MLGKSVLLLAAFALLPFAAPAAQTCQSTDDLSWLLAPAAPIGVATKAICQASCPSGGAVSCSYTPPSTCSAVDSNCATGVVGYVQCGSSAPVYCATACACTNGATMWEIVGCCEDGSGRSLKDRYLCVDGEWEYQYTSCGLPATCPRFP